jgi:predicted O-methyltransferase YrrM
VTPPLPQRSREFRQREHDRFWWHKLADTDYVPSIYAALSDAEWAVLQEWYDETEATGHIGEINVPAMCLIQGLISGGAVRRVVQLGHYYGYSSLVLGFVLRAMNARPGLVSIDIDEAATVFTDRWVRRAGLSDHVSLLVGDSAAESSVRWAEDELGGEPQLILVDSSHQYRHTLTELDRWVPQLPVGAIMTLHDTSRFAQAWDPTGEGGVRRALDEWLPLHPEVASLSLNAFTKPGDDGDALVYKDACGLGILQKIA